MLNINNKMYLNKRFTAVDVEFNTMPEIVLAHILAHAYSIADTHIEDIEFDDVLYIADTHIQNGTLLLESNDFREAGVTIQRSNFPKRVRCCHAFEFNELNEDILPYREGVNLVVIGYINTIPEHIFTNIQNFFGSSVNYVVFGDPIIDAPEHNSYFMRYLTNSSVSIRLDYDSYRKSDKKKINNTLFKLRRDVTDTSDITASNHVSITSSSSISIPDIANFLNSRENLVVVPKRLYPKIQSMLYQYITSRSLLDLQPGDVYLLKNTWTCKQGNIRYVVPPLTTVRIMKIYNQVFIQNHRCFVCDVSLEDPNGQFVLMNNVVIDFTDYLFDFDARQHPENLEDYDDIVRNINQFNTTIHDSSVMKIMFSGCITSDMIKYYPSKATRAYIETIGRDAYYTTDFNWYKIFCNTTELMDIVFTQEFIEIN